MFAKRRHFRLKNGSYIETPLLVPSFSSKTFHDEKVVQVIECMAQTITDAILISAYDLYYRHIRKKLTFPSVIFLDSGGYEASEDVDLSDTGKGFAQSAKWTLDCHKR